jgi:hypothetical protein
MEDHQNDQSQETEDDQQLSSLMKIAATEVRIT